MTAVLPRVAIVGRPNVGKSTLLNRFVGKRVAIVQERPGVTRDRGEHEVDWCGRRFLVIDTGGWQARPDDPIDTAIREQAERAIKGADVALFVIDAQVGVTGEDDEAARLLLRAGIPTLLVANKVDGPVGHADLSDLYGLGLGDPIPVSALHGRYSGDLLDKVLEVLPEVDDAVGVDAGAEASIAIVGRPNVGKSTLFNRLAGDERSIVHDMPGTTRDTVDTLVELDGTTYRFVDTAGLRRRSRVDDETEYYSRVRALRALERADVALLVVDATEGVTFADQKVAEEVLAAGKAVVVLLNKWDLLDADAKAAAADTVTDELRFLDWAPVLRISALTGANVKRLAATLSQVLDEFRRRVPTHVLTKVVEEAQQRHPPPLIKGKRPTRIRYATQPRAEPPMFVMFANRRLQTDYLRYLEHRLRAQFGFAGTPVRIRVKVNEPKTKG
ncbi:MAG: ribosome biogenesis GTPase Der [Acidimicrobiia bacterium]|nr:ribosome biogenesis GTPase Der [Acidimicrobiia bacterium]